MSEDFDFRAGDKVRLHNGDIETINEIELSSPGIEIPYPILTESGLTFTRGGKYFGDHRPDGSDIVENISKTERDKFVERSNEVKSPADLQKLINDVTSVGFDFRPDDRVQLRNGKTKTVKRVDETSVKLNDFFGLHDHAGKHDDGDESDIVTNITGEERARISLKIAKNSTYGKITDVGVTSSINRITREDVGQFEYLAHHSVEFDAMTRYQEIATKSAIYPGQGTPLGLMYCALKLNGEAGELAEHVGKAMRDDGFGPKAEVHTRNSSSGVKRAYSYIHGSTLTPERKELVVKEIGDVLWYLSAICNELDITLSDAAITNLKKLCDRTEREALRGSGDDR